MRFVTFVFAVLIAVPAMAQSTVSVETFCRLLPNYQQPAGVEYQPGVGADGPVVPADVGGAPAIASFETIEIPVEVDLVQRFGIPVQPGVELQPYAALMSIHKDGRVDYNGQDITTQAHQLCAGKPK
jgi:hypothetical protein